MGIKFSLPQPRGIGRMIPQPVSNVFRVVGKGLFGKATQPKPKPKPVGPPAGPVHRVF
jgi:hypothetical protein